MMRISALAVVVLAGLAVAGCASTTSTSSPGSGQLSAGQPGAGQTSPAGGLNGSSTGPGMGGTASAGPPVASGVPGSASALAIAATCPSNQNFAVPNGPTAKPIPLDIQVSWVLRCTIVTKTGDRTLVAERSTGSPTALVAALKVPSAQRAKVVCPMYVVAVPYFALVESNGQVFVPSIPLNNCAKPQPQVLQALNELRFSVLSSKPLN